MAPIVAREKLWGRLQNTAFLIGNARIDYWQFHYYAEKNSNRKQGEIMAVQVERGWGVAILPSKNRFVRAQSAGDVQRQVEREQDLKELSDRTEFPIDFILAVEGLLIGQQSLQVVLHRFLEDDDTYRQAPELTWRDASRVYKKFYPQQ